MSTPAKGAPLRFGSWAWSFVGVPAAGLVGIGLYAGSLRSVTVAGVALLIATGAWVSGGLLGFIFGIPRSLREPAAAEGAGEPQYRSNTNLEQISDWLTKIIVGLALVELRRLVNEVNNLIDFLAPAIGGKPSSPSFALALLAIFGVSGFLSIYVFTRIFLSRLFAETEAEMIIRKIEEVAKKVEQIERP